MFLFFYPDRPVFKMALYNLITSYFPFSYEDLLKAYDKAKPVIEKEEKGVVPRFFIRFVILT